MKNGRALLYAAGGLVWALIPVVAYAIDPLVPCTGLNCDLCSVGQLIQNVINFLVGISIPISVAMFGWAGVTMIINPESPEKQAKGKKIFQSVFLGFVLVLCGWLVVQTVLSVLVKKDFWIGGKWNNLECVNPAERFETMHGTIGSFIDDVIGTPVTVESVPTPAGVNYSCPPGFTQTGPQGSQCQGPNGTVAATATLVPAPGVSTIGGTRTQAQLAAGIAAAQQYYTQVQLSCNAEKVQNCTLAKAIMPNESGGRAYVISPAGCVGLMQVCPRTARGLDPALKNLSDAEVTTRLQNPTYNIELGVKYVAQLERQFSNPAEIVAAYNGGPRANNASHTCPGERWWQCTQNGGYAETRAYVPNVLNTASLISQ